LTQISTTNVADLKPVWSFGTGSLRGHEGAPLVVGSTMYLVSPYPNAVFALDLAKAGAPVVWRYAVPLPAASGPAAAAAARSVPPTGCCDMPTRGLAYHPSGKILVALYQGELAAVDAKTGREVWRVKNAEGRLGATMPGAPLVVRDLVIVGTGGAEFGARGTVTAYDVATGRLAWRVWHTGPDADVAIEGEANSQYSSHRGRNLGVSTWPADGWSRGGATASGALSYDPDLDLVFYGTDRAAGYNAASRPGDNKWSATIFARSPATGKVKWAYQLTPHDQWGYDGSNENILVDLAISGRPVKALVHFDRNGFAYTFDRTNGKLLLAERFGSANWATRVDLGEGIPMTDPRYLQGKATVAGICPAAIGSKGQEPAAYSPTTGLFYVPTSNLCMDLTPVSAAPGPPGTPVAGANIKMGFGPGPNHGRFIAWNAATATIAWQVQEAYPVTGGALATAGGLVFYGTLDGWFKAIDGKTGIELWRFKTPSGIVGSPIAFQGPDGKQYVAVFSGIGGWIGAGANGAFPDLDKITNPGGVLMVFGL
jgi:PQQ-dependent dehydrogenase (methanol/ethanol family)